MAVGVPNDRRRSTEMKKDLQQICADFNSVTLTSGGFRILLRGVRDFAPGGSQIDSGGRHRSSRGEGRLTLINRHSFVIKPIKFSRKGLSVLDNLISNT